MVGEPNSKVKSQEHRPASHCPTSTTRVNLLICQENKSYRGPDTTSPEPDRKEPQGRGILSRLAAQSLFRFRLGGRRPALPPQRERGRRGERLPGVCRERRCDAARLFRAVSVAAVGGRPRPTPPPGASTPSLALTISARNKNNFGFEMMQRQVITHDLGNTQGLGVSYRQFEAGHKEDGTRLRAAQSHVPHSGEPQVGGR